MAAQAGVRQEAVRAKQVAARVAVARANRAVGRAGQGRANRAAANQAAVWMAWAEEGRASLGAVWAGEGWGSAAASKGWGCITCADGQQLTVRHKQRSIQIPEPVRTLQAICSKVGSLTTSCSTTTAQRSTAQRLALTWVGAARETVAAGWGCKQTKAGKAGGRPGTCMHMPCLACLRYHPMQCLHSVQHDAHTWGAARVAAGWGWEAARVAAGWGWEVARAVAGWGCKQADNSTAGKTNRKA